jgi:hypothetical protein
MRAGDSRGFNPKSAKERTNLGFNWGDRLILEEIVYGYRR